MSRRSPFSLALTLALYEGSVSGIAYFKLHPGVGYRLLH